MAQDSDTLQQLKNLVGAALKAGGGRLSRPMQRGEALFRMTLKLLNGIKKQLIKAMQILKTI